MRRSIIPALKSALVIGCLSLVMACSTTPTPYAPAMDGRKGFHETRIEPDRWRVSFAGNAQTPRQTVEDYLLYRAAELTLREGYDWFLTVERTTDADTTRVHESDLRPHHPIHYDPYWLHWSMGYGYDPYWVSLYRPSRVTEWREIKTYEAIAEIVMGQGPKPKGEAQAFDARQVIDNLEGQIVRPGP